MVRLWVDSDVCEIVEAREQMTEEPHWAVVNNDAIHNIWHILNIKKSTLDLIKTMAYLKRVLVVKTRQSPLVEEVTPIPHRIFSVICE